MRRTIVLLVLPLLILASAGLPLAAGASCGMAASGSKADCPLCAHRHCDMAGGRATCGMTGGHCAMDGHCGDHRDAAGLFVFFSQPALLAHGAAPARPARATRLAAVATRLLPTVDPAAPWEPPRS
ncbi:MAG: hypothetical protein KGN76_06015 [Acidobacteriota bacterium]|nr:hypothetical protein [Acidobacteriota bacterium]